MIFYLMLLLVLVFAGATALGLTIYALVKQRKKMLNISLISLIILIGLTVFTAYKYVTAGVDYLRSDEFQTQTKSAAETAGKTIGSAVSGAAQGLGNSLDEDNIASLAKKSGKIFGNGVKALVSGTDEAIGAVTVFEDSLVASKGIQIGRAEETLNADKASLGLYLSFQEDYTGQLVLTIYDSKGQKQDKASLTLKEPKGKEGVYEFQFTHFQPGLSSYCILSEE